MSEDEETFNAGIEVSYDGDNKLCMHKELATGSMPDGRDFRVIQNMMGAGHIMVQVDKEDGDGWKSYSVNVSDLAEGVLDAIREYEEDEA